MTDERDTPPGRTVVPPPLCEHARRALERSLVAVRAGQPINVIGRAIESEAKRGGFQVIHNLCGHGQPFLSTGATHVETAEDGWTEKTPDGSLTAQYEHTVVVTRRRPIVLTRA